MKANLPPLDYVPLSEVVPGASSMRDFLTSGHGSIFAMTRAGKTELMRYFMKRRIKPLRVFYNPEEESVPGHQVADAEGLKRAIMAGHRSIVVTPPDTANNHTARFAAVAQVLWRIGDDLKRRNGGNKAPPWCILFVDEAQVVAGKDADPENPLRVILHRGLKRGIVAWCASQEPNLVSHSVMTQAQTFILLEVNRFRAPYLEGYGVPVGEIWDRLKQKYHGAVIHGNRVAFFRPIPKT